MSSFAVFLIWYLASMIVAFPLTYQWISYLLKEHRRKEIGRQSSAKELNTPRSTQMVIRAKVKVGPPLEFSSGADDFVLTEEGKSVIDQVIQQKEDKRNER